MGTIVQINPDVDVKGPQAVPAGRYQLRINKVDDPVKAETSDNMIVKTEFEIVNNDDDTLNGRKIFQNFTLTESAFYRLKQCVIACGLETEESLKEKAGRIDISLLPSCVCEASVGTRTHEYQGEMRTDNTIKSFLIQE